MKVIRGINNIGKFKDPVVALGVFDGVHRGHREILRATAEKAHEIGGMSIALTFWPHPQGQESLYSLEHRLRLIEELGIDVCIVINFSPHFAKIKAEKFIKDILAKKINARYVYVGKNFRFGRGAKGDIDLLRMSGNCYGFKAEGLGIIQRKSRPVSSTLIRGLIKNGNIKSAQDLLGRPVSILGTVIKGTAIGRILGFPTANINPHHEVIPESGIYAVRIIFGKKKLKGVCYIGKRPTLNIMHPKVNVEVHIFNFRKNIYGKYLEIQFVKRMRPDKKFPNLYLLSKQIKTDIKSAKKLLS